jgi:hypothetical protein
MQSVEAKTLQKETVDHWTDLWFTENKKAGYIGVTTNFYKYYFYGYKNVEDLKKNTHHKKKKFITINSFALNDNVNDKNKVKLFTRELVNLKQIRNIAIDIDQYKVGLTIDQAIDKIHYMIETEKIPEPNLVLTSRGIQLFYTISNGASPNMGWLVEYITEQFIMKFASLGADWNAKDLSRLMRVPNSINERNNKIVKWEIWNDKTYTLKELQLYCKPLDIFATRKKKKVSSIKSYALRLEMFHRTNRARLKDLRKLIELRKGNFTNCRNTFIYILSYHQSFYTNTKKETLAAIINDIKHIYTDDPKAEKMTKSWLMKTVNSAYDDAKTFFEHYVSNGYKIIYKANDGIIKPYKTSNLIKKLYITEEEQYHLSSIRNSDIAKIQDKERKSKERRKKGVQSRKEYEHQRKQRKLDLMKKVNQLKEQNLSNRVIAEQLGISKVYVGKLLKEYKGLTSVSR